MKRWLWVILCTMFSSVLLISCAASPASAPESSSETPNRSTMQQIGEQAAGITFADQLEWSDSILEARFLYEEDYGLYQLYYFEPLRQIRGRIDEQAFAVRYVCQSVEFTESGPRGERAPYSFKPGHEYLLLLERFVSVTQPRDYYCIIGDHIYEKPDAAGEAVEAYQHRLTDIAQAVEGIPLQSPPYTGKDYIRSEEPEALAAGSNYIVKAQVVESSGGNELNDTQWFYCRFTEVYKFRGPVPEGNVEVIFPAGRVSPGDECFLLLTYPDNVWPENTPAPFYIMSSKHSIYRLDDPVVEKILRAAEQSA